MFELTEDIHIFHVSQDTKKTQIPALPNTDVHKPSNKLVHREGMRISHATFFPQLHLEVTHPGFHLSSGWHPIIKLCLTISFVANSDSICAQQV